MTSSEKSKTSITIQWCPEFRITVSLVVVNALIALGRMHYDAVCRHMATGTEQDPGVLVLWHRQISNGFNEVCASFRDLDTTLKICELMSYAQLMDETVRQALNDYCAEVGDALRSANKGPQPPIPTPTLTLDRNATLDDAAALVRRTANDPETRKRNGAEYVAGMQRAASLVTRSAFVPHPANWPKGDEVPVKKSDSPWWDAPAGYWHPADLEDAIDQMQDMRNDWAKVGGALGFDRFVDPEDLVLKACELSTKPLLSLEGWSFGTECDGTSVCAIAPNSNPGGMWLTNNGRLERRLLFALVCAILNDRQQKD